MKKVLLSLFFTLSFSLNINVDYYKKNDNRIEILTIKNSFDFSCDVNKNIIKCKFNKRVADKIFNMKTIFFRVYPISKRDSLQLYIYVKKNFYIKTFEDNLVDNSLITPFKLKHYKKLVVIASDKKFINSLPNIGLHFYFKHTITPYVGAIDENGNPLNSVKSEDVIKYFSILRRYKKGADVLDDINNFIENYPHSIFMPDILFLKMKILDENSQNEEVIDIAKKWIKNYSYDDNLVKVLILMAKSYTKLGFMSDASYLYSRIINEYQGSEESYLAMIYLADQLFITGEDKKAFELYKKALINTKNLQIASLAAERLAQRYMDKGDINLSIKYYNKIYKANKNYLLKDKEKAFKLAKSLAEHNSYDLAIKILKDLFSSLKKTDDLYEKIEYYLALWYYDKGDYKDSLKWINRYLNDFPYGDFVDKIESLQEKVLFEVDDKNLTKQLNFINSILKKYKGSEIATKAFVKKIKLLYKLKRYKEILNQEKEILKISDSDFKNKKEFLNRVKKEYALYLLNHNKCMEFSNFMKKYRIVLDKKFDDKIYNCYVKVKNYELASIVCNKYLDSVDDKVFIKWMKRKIFVLEKLQDYKNEILAIDDLCGVYKKCYEYMVKKFFALWYLKRYEEAIKLSLKLNQYKNIKNLDVYYDVMQYAIQNKNRILASSFALKIINLQNYFKTYPYSPIAEFTYVKYSDDKKKKIEILKSLLNRVKGENLARVYYMLANLTNDKKYLLKCVKVKNSTLWKSLCQDGLNSF